MKGSNPVQAASLPALWRRAPLWRWSVLMGGTLSLLTAVLAWETLAPARGAGPLPQATYAPQSPPTAAAAPAPAPSPAPVMTRPVASDPAPPANAALSLASPTDLGTGTTVPDRRELRQELSAHGFRVPLPPGVWQVLANQRLNLGDRSGDAYFLGQVDKQRLTGAVIVYALSTNVPPGSGFDDQGACHNSNAIYLSPVDGHAHGHQACWLLTNYFTPPWQQWGSATHLPSLTRAAAGEMVARGIAYPQDFLAVSFVRAESWGLLNASYLFSAEHAGFTSSVASTVQESDWSAANLYRFPDKAAYAVSLKEWGAAKWRQFNDVVDAAGREVPSAAARLDRPGASTPPLSIALGADRSQSASAFDTAQSGEALRAWPGDSLAKIQVAYPGSPAPTPFHSSDRNNQQELWLRDRGVRFFLSIDGMINTVRLDSPFAGAVHGVHLGDSLDDVARRLGSAGQDAVAKRVGGASNGYLFTPDVNYRLRVDVGADRRVQTIFLFR